MPVLEQILDYSEPGEWLPFWALAPAQGQQVDLLSVEIERTVTVYAVRWPYPGDWTYWRCR